jgi:hypothetical protein
MKVKELFRQFDSTDSSKERKAIADTAIVELDIHSRIEEEIFYPAVRRMRSSDEQTEEMMNEAEEEHHVVDLLSQELTKMQADDPEFAAKFTVLAENVKHHIEEEESEMLPQADQLGPDTLQRLGSDMEKRRQELQTSGNGRTRSPARTRSATRKAATTTRTRGSTTSRKATGTRASSARRTPTGKPAKSRSGSQSGSGSRSRGKSRK